MTVRVVFLTLADIAFKVDKYFVAVKMSCIEMMSMERITLFAS